MGCDCRKIGLSMARCRLQRRHAFRKTVIMQDGTYCIDSKKNGIADEHMMVDRAASGLIALIKGKS